MENTGDVIVRYAVGGKSQCWVMNIGPRDDVLGAYSEERETEETRIFYRDMKKVLKTIQLDYYKQRGTQPQLISIDRATKEEVSDWHKKYDAWNKGGRKGVIS